MMDFKGWKKEAEDKNTVTMCHEKGHKMTLALKAMPKIQREQLKRLPLADGGEVKKKNIEEQGGVKFYDQGSITPVSAVSAVPAPQVNAPEASEPLLNPDWTLNAPAAVSLQQGAAREQQAVDTAKGVAAANMERGYIQGNNAIQQNLQNNVNELKTHTDETANAIKGGLINPNHYQESMGTGEKVATAFGLLMGGFSQGFSGGSNPAMDYLNGQIQRDIDAQRARSDQQKTILGAYQSLYGDQVVAQNLTKIALNDAYVHKGYQIAAQLATAQAKATADAFAAQKGIDNKQLLLDSAGRMGKLGPQPQPQATQINPNQGIVPTNFHPGEQQAPQNEAEEPILNPNAQQHLDTLRYTPKANDELDQIKQQYTQAQMADNLLGQLHDVHQKMYQDAIEGGSSGYLRRHDPTSHIPFAGPLISGTTVRPMTDTAVNRDYDANKTRIVSDIANALRGTNVSGEEIQHIVDANSPEHGDTPEMRAQKENNIRIFIKNSVPKSLLKDWGLSR